VGEERERREKGEREEREREIGERGQAIFLSCCKEKLNVITESFC
jgi:hypothetical protein